MTPSQKRRVKRRKNLQHQRSKDAARTLVRFNPRTGTVIRELNPNYPGFKL
jgi:hypothetical protein